MKKLFLTLLFLFSFDAKALMVLESEVLDAIKSEAANPEIELEVFAGQTTFDVKDAKGHKILVSNLKFDDAQNRFACVIEIFADGKAVANSDVMGKFYNLKEVYVPSQEVKKGSVITDKMLAVKKVKENKAKSIFATNLEDLVGKETKKDLSQGELVLNKDIQKPILVNKNDFVMVLYKTNKMEIGMKAYAQQNGAKGDVIELVNPTSKKSVMGKVVSKNTVIIEGEE